MSGIKTRIKACIKNIVVNLYNEEGSSKSDTGDFAEAITNYDKAIELDPKFAPAYYNKGLVKAALGKYEAAIAYYDKAVKLGVEEAIVYCARGDSKAILGKYESGDCRLRQNH